MSLLDHAEREFRALGWPGDDDFQEEVCDGLFRLLRVFGEQGHSGTTAPYMIHLFERLASYKPIGPLTGEDWEWLEVSDEGLYQNVRCGEVFKQDGEAYWAFGKVFRYPDGVIVTRAPEGRVTIESFPWSMPPEPEVIELDSDGGPLSDGMEDGE